MTDMTLTAGLVSSLGVGSSEKIVSDLEKNSNDIKKAASQFETLFISQLLKEMKKTIPGGGFLPQGLGNDIYESLIESELADSLAQKGIGLAPAFERMLEGGIGRIQGGSSGQTQGQIQEAGTGTDTRQTQGQGQAQWPAPTYK